MMISVLVDGWLRSHECTVRLLLSAHALPRRLSSTSGVVQALSVASESQQSTTVSDASGRFDLGNVVPGHVDLTFATPAGDGASSSLELTPGQKVADLRIVLDPPLAMADGENGAPSWKRSSLRPGTSYCDPRAGTHGHACCPKR